MGRNPELPTELPAVAWAALACGDADALDGARVEITGWMAPPERAEAHSYFLLAPEAVCCFGCLPRDPLACVEVFAKHPIPMPSGPARLVGRWRCLTGDPAGWRYQLCDAELIAAPPGVTRRALLAASALIGLAACSAGPAGGTATQANDAAAAEKRAGDARKVIAAGVTVDMHSHAGRIIGMRNVSEHRSFSAVAAPMREGGMTAICLAMVADSPTTHVAGGRITAYRSPAPGELYAWSRDAFARVHALAETQKLAIVTDPASLQAAHRNGPAVIVSAEGADFLEGDVARVEEAYHAYGLRHLQLTHYRVNELGDIQTEAPVHGGLTDFGVEVIASCNRLGIVVDVAHGTYDLVKRAAKVTQKPLILSHTSLSAKPGPRSRLISADHARVVAETGGVIGIWPPVTIFRTRADFAEGMARMADVVGVDHVGLGSDMLGLLSASSFPDYDELPDLAEALLATGFSPEEIGKILGGNYARVFSATVA